MGVFSNVYPAVSQMLLPLVPQPLGLEDFRGSNDKRLAIPGQEAPSISQFERPDLPKREEDTQLIRSPSLASVSL